MWCVIQKWGNFAHFQSSISPLSLMMELRFSLLACRNSYIVYPKNVFSMTLSLSSKVKLHTRLALPHFHQKWQQGCIQRLSKKPLLQLLASICRNDIIKKIHLAELGAIYQMGEFFKIFKVHYLCYF